MTWDELKDINIKPHRKPEIEEEYKKFIKNKQMNNYIITNVIKDKNKELFLTTNKFPYDLEDNVLHLIIWDLNFHDNENKNKIRYKSFIKNFFKLKKFDIIYRVNKKEHQSIPEIKHCHIFLKVKKL